MRGILAACAAAVLVVGGGRAADKIDPAKLVGKWEITKTEDETAPKGAVVEFTKDKKVTLTIDAGGKKVELGGTYKVDADKLTVTFKAPDSGKESSDTDTIKSLTDDKLVLVDNKGKATEFARKK